MNIQLAPKHLSLVFKGMFICLLKIKLILKTYESLSPKYSEEIWDCGNDVVQQVGLVCPSLVKEVHLLDGNKNLVYLEAIKRNSFSIRFAASVYRKKINSFVCNQACYFFLFFFFFLPLTFF